MKFITIGRFTVNVENVAYFVRKRDDHIRFVFCAGNNGAPLAKEFKGPGVADIFEAFAHEGISIKKDPESIGADAPED